MLAGDATSTNAGEEGSGSIKHGESVEVEVDAEEGHTVTVGFSVPAPPSPAKQTAQRSDSASDLHSLHSVSGCTVKGFTVVAGEGEGEGATTGGADSPLDAAAGSAAVRDAAAAAAGAGVAAWGRDAANYVAAQQAHAPHAPRLAVGGRHPGALQGSLHGALQGSLHGVAFQAGAYTPPLFSST